MTAMTTVQIARSVMGHVQDAVGEMASDMLSPQSGFLDDKWSKQIKKARKNGVEDIQGWLADELYNDPDTLSDLMGDQIYDLVRGDEAEYKKVLDELDKNPFPGLKKAIKTLRKP